MISYPLSSRANSAPARGTIIRTWDIAAGCMWLLKLSVLSDKLMANLAVKRNVMKPKKGCFFGNLTIKSDTRTVPDPKGNAECQLVKGMLKPMVTVDSRAKESKPTVV